MTTFSLDYHPITQKKSIQTKSHATNNTKTVTMHITIDNQKNLHTYSKGRGSTKKHDIAVVHSPDIKTKY